MIRLTYENWLKRFRPIANPFDENAGVDGYLFQPYGRDWAFVRERAERCIWTVTITDLVRTSAWHITDGVHIVNREGYLVTSVPAPPARSYVIRY
jgi:hypothetical protein